MRYTFVAILGFFLFTVTARAQTKEADSIFIAKCMEVSGLENPARTVAMMEAVRQYVQHGDEHSLMTAANVLFYVGMPTESDSIFLEAAKKYPAGEAARTVEFSKVGSMKGSADEKVAAFKKAALRFPENDESKQLYDRTRAEIAKTYYTDGNRQEMKKWVAAIRDTLLKSATEVEIAETAVKKKDVVLAKKMMTAGIERMQGVTANRAEYKEYRVGELFKYAAFLYEIKEHQHALQVITEVHKASDNPTAALQKLYADILIENKQDEKALDILSVLLKEGKGNDEIRATVKKLYAQTKGSLKGYDAYVKALDDEMKASAKKDTTLKLLQEEAPLFTLNGLNGDTVTLKELKGKVVILDFWATWCGPCKRSFPAMKAAMKRYSADTGVVFLFIDCMEREKNVRETIKQFLDKNQYPFHVLLDEVSTVASLYGVKGIPNKIIIDRSGIVRFRMLGFEEGDDAAVERLSMMIEAARKAE